MSRDEPKRDVASSRDSDGPRGSRRKPSIVLLAGAVLSIGLSGCGAANQADAPVLDRFAERELDAALAHNNDFGRVMTECLNDYGFPAIDPGGGGYDAPVLEFGDRKAYRLAEDRCAEDNGYPDPAPPLSDGAYSVLYDRLLDTYRCLVESGFDPVDPVSRADFIDSHSLAWHPYDSAVDMPPDMAYACPVM